MKRPERRLITAGSDDPRESLAYKLRKILTLKAKSVLCTDPHIADDRFVPLDVVLAMSAASDAALTLGWLRPPAIRIRREP